MPGPEAQPASLVIPPYEESFVWQQNKHRAGTEMVRAIRFISWFNEGLTPQLIDGLHAHDDAAHEEAKEFGVLFYESAAIIQPEQHSKLPAEKQLHVPDYSENSCGWKTVEASQLALHGLKHRRAKMYPINHDMYKEVRIEILDSTYVGDGEYEFDLVNVLTKDDIVRHAGIQKAS